jgi:hypothetical protein
MIREFIAGTNNERNLAADLLQMQLAASGVGSAYSGEIVSSGIFVACMAARGWREDPNGPAGRRFNDAVRDFKLRH